MTTIDLTTTKQKTTIKTKYNTITIDTKNQNMHTLMNQLIQHSKISSRMHPSSSFSSASIDIVRDLQDVKERIVKVLQSNSTDANHLQPFLIPKHIKQLQVQQVLDEEGKGDDKYLLQYCASKNGLNRLLDVFDNQTALVRVEMGTSYMDTNIQTINLPIHQFSQYLRLLQEQQTKAQEEEEADDNSNNNTPIAPIVYLAQQSLQEIVPHIPLPVSLDILNNNEAAYDIYSNVSWIGPNNTFSPFHTDPHHNSFEQCLGSKCFRLINPMDSKKIQRSKLPNQQNTIGANVDLECVGVNVMEVVVGEGEELFMPSHWMHEVTSVIDASRPICVSNTTWWRSR